MKYSYLQHNKVFFNVYGTSRIRKEYIVANCFLCVEQIYGSFVIEKLTFCSHLNVLTVSSRF